MISMCSDQLKVHFLLLVHLTDKWDEFREQNYKRGRKREYWFFFAEKQLPQVKNVFQTPLQYNGSEQKEISFTSVMASILPPLKSSKNNGHIHPRKPAGRQHLIVMISHSIYPELVYSTSLQFRQVHMASVHPFLTCSE